MPTVCISCGKGGVGKSTTAASLGACLRELGLSVALIDMERQHFLSAYKSRRWPHVYAADEKSLPAVLSDSPCAWNVIDSPVNERALQAAALTCADLCIIPVRPSRVALQGALGLYKGALRLQTPAKLLLTMYSGRRPEFQQFRQECRDGADLFDTTVPRTLDFDSADLLDAGTILDYAPQSPAAKAYRRLTKEIMLWQEEVSHS